MILLSKYRLFSFFIFVKPIFDFPAKSLNFSLVLHLSLYNLYFIIPCFLPQCLVSPLPFRLCCCISKIFIKYFKKDLRQRICDRRSAHTSYFTFTFLLPAFLICLISLFLNLAELIFFCIFTVSFTLVPFRAFLPKVLSTLDCTLIFLRFLHPLKAAFPTLVTLLPIVTFFNLVYPLNAFALISVTVQVALFTITVF